MKRAVVFSLLGILFCMMANAQEKKQKFNITTQLGYFQEDFRWSIAGINDNNNYVNILSELRWENLRGPQANINLQYNFWKGFFVQGNFSTSLILSGSVTDTDFGEDNRKDTLYHDTFDSNEGNIISFGGSLGYKIKFHENYSISPFIGFSSNQQSLYIVEVPGGLLTDLRCTYETQWNGLTLGLDSKIPIGKFIIQPLIIYHQVNYSAKANWNLIETFKHPVSFTHDAKGFGIEPALNFHYTLNKTISILLGGKSGYWSTGKGVDTLYLTDGSTSTTQLNGAIRNNWSINLGASFSF